MKRTKLKITSRCNLSCRCCWEAAGLDAPGRPDGGARDCPPGLAKQAIDDTADAGWDGIIFCGGEVTLVDGFIDHVRYAKTRGLNVMMNTNGVNLNGAALDELIEAGLDILMISLYSLDPQVYRYIRGGVPGSFDRVMDTARRVSERLRQKASHLDVRIMTVLMKPTLGGLPDLLRFVLEMGFSALSTNYLVGARELSDLKLSIDDLRTFHVDIVPRLSAVLAESGLDERTKEAGRRAIQSFFSRENVTPQNWTDGEYRPSGAADCNCRERFLLVRPDGTAAPCWGFEFTDDNRFTESMSGSRHLADVLSGERFERFWKTPFPFCRYCPKGFQVWIPARPVRPSDPPADGADGIRG